MTIWILALALFICLGLVGYNQGAIRAALSIIGLVVASLLAVPLSPMVAPVIKWMLGIFSVKNPILISAVSPTVVFLTVLTLCKIGAFALHRKIEIYYKYKAGDLRLSLWERVNQRIGACLGLINAFIYLLLISVVIYVMGYWTTQVSQPETDTIMIRILNRAVNDLHSTGMDRIVRAVDPMKDDFYVAGDIVGIVYHNPLAASRLSHYPTFLDLAERREFVELASDKDFLEMLQRQAPVREILGNPKSQAILSNPDLLKEIWSLIAPDLKDLREFMGSGESAKYAAEPILGRWTYDPAASAIALKQSRPSASVSQIKTMRQLMAFAYDKSSFIATPTHQVFLKDSIWIKPGDKTAATSPNPATRTGKWQNNAGSYKISLSGGTKEMTATIGGKKELMLSGDWAPLVFAKEE